MNYVKSALVGVLGVVVTLPLAVIAVIAIAIRSTPLEGIGAEGGFAGVGAVSIGLKELLVVLLAAIVGFVTPFTWMLRRLTRKAA